MTTKLKAGDRVTLCYDNKIMHHVRGVVLWVEGRGRVTISFEEWNGNQFAIAEFYPDSKKNRQWHSGVRTWSNRSTQHTAGVSYRVYREEDFKRLYVNTGMVPQEMTYLRPDLMTFKATNRNKRSMYIVAASEDDARKAAVEKGFVKSESNVKLEDVTDEIDPWDAETAVEAA